MTSEIKTITRKQAYNYNWYPIAGTIRWIDDNGRRGFYCDRMMVFFSAIDHINEKCNRLIKPTQVINIMNRYNVEPYVYFNRGDKKYRVAL